MLAKHLKSIHKIGRNNPEFVKKIKELEVAAGIGEASQSNRSLDTMDEFSSSDVRRLRVAGDDSMTYTCSQCEFTATDRALFVAHIEEHRESYAHQCAECGSCFSVLPALRRHLFAVHRVRDFDKYCSDTGVSLETTDDVTDVVDGCTLSMEAESDRVVATAVKVSKTVVSPRVSTSPVAIEGRLECTVCYKVFEDELTHRSHMRVHGMAFIQRTRRSIPPVGVSPTPSTILTETVA